MCVCKSVLCRIQRWRLDAVDATRCPKLGNEIPVAAPLETSGEGGARHALRILKEHARGGDGGAYMWVASAGLGSLRQESPATASAVAFGYAAHASAADG